jgi:hypothetical protein
MTPKEKAQQLVDKMSGFTIEDCKRNATTCVEEIISELDKLHKPEYTTFITRQAVFINGGLSEETETCDGYELNDYWDEVKQEINNI